MFLFLYYFYTVYVNCQFRSFTSVCRKDKKREEKRAVSFSPLLSRCLACMFCVKKHCGEEYGDASDAKLQDETIVHEK